MVIKLLLNTQIILVIFMIPDMLSNKKLHSVVTEWFIRDRKLNIYLVFITQSYFNRTKRC